MPRCVRARTDSGRCPDRASRGASRRRRNSLCPGRSGRPPSALWIGRRRRARSWSSASRRAGYLVRGVLDRLHDIRVARASAQVTGDRAADLFLRWMRIFLEQRDGAHHHSGRAEAALEAMLFDEALLNRMELAIGLEAFDRPQFSTVCLHCEDRAGFHRLAIEQDRASSAVRRIAANMRSGEAEVLSEEMDQ